MPSCMSYLGLTFGILALGCSACALGLEYWVEGYLGFTHGDFYSGLWTRCKDHPIMGTTCEEFDTLDGDYKAALNAVRSMVVIGAFFQLVSICVGCVSLVTRKLAAEVHLGLVSAAGIAFGGLCLMIGFSVYMEAFFYPLGWANKYDLSAGFILCVIGWLLSWTAAALILAGTCAMKRRKLIVI